MISPPLSSSRWSLYTPKLLTILQRGYGLSMLRSDITAGITVAVVALPLSMALAIASGASPDRGLVTAIVAGFLIAALGGSRFQIGGPTAAFAVIVSDIIGRHGYEGLIWATLMGGGLLVLFGLARLGTWIKYIPYPVVTGFTAGIALIIFISQIKDLLGLPTGTLPGGFFPRLEALALALPGIQPATAAVGAGTLATILILRRWKPSWPGFLIAIAGAALVSRALNLPVETIGSRFGGIPQSLPSPHLPATSLQQLKDLFPDALTIALLAGVESLLSAVVADGMTRSRHRSNCELVAQGVGNMAAAVMGGFCATGALARTATNIRAGARSPVAGMIHAAVLLLFVLAAAPLASFLPLAALAATLLVVAWNMSEHHHVRRLLKAPAGDRLLLLLTFSLTILFDLTVAVQAGVVLSAILFMHRMTRAVEQESGMRLIADDEADSGPLSETTGSNDRTTAVYTINGPFFFGVAARVSDVLEQIGPPLKTLVIDLSNVPIIDATAAHALNTVIDQCHHQGTALHLRDCRPEMKAVLASLGIREGNGLLFVSTDDGIAAGKQTGPLPRKD